MTWTWAWHAAPGLAAGLLAPVLAGLVLWASPSRDQNRLLALLLLLAGAEVAGSFGLAYVAVDDGLRETIDAASTAAVLASPWVYMAFLGTVPSPLTQPLRARGVRWALVGLAGLVLAAWPLLAPFVAATYEDGVRQVPQGFLMAVTWHGLVLTYGFLVALSNWWTAPEGPSRERGAVYALAFGTRDAGLTVAIFGVQAFALLGLPVPAWVTGTLGQVALISLPTLAFVLLLAYGVLETQLFDIPLKIKAALRRSALVGVFATVFVLVSETLEGLVEGAAGDWAGLVAAIVLGLSLRPLESLAEQVAERAMPGVEDTEAYRAERKAEVYQATVEDVLADGTLSDRDRRLLDNLQERLEVPEEDAREVELDVADTLGVDLDEPAA